MAVHYPLKKNILWVDDFDIKSSSMHKSSKTRSKLSKEQLIKNKISVFDEKYRDSIEVKTSLYDGIKYIFEHHNELDCVILDVNMKKGLRINAAESSESRDIWNDFLEKINIKYKIEYEGNKPQYIVERGNQKISIEEYIGADAGYYLVRLLTSLGFPQNRITMFTAYGHLSNVKEWERKFNESNTIVPPTIDKAEYFNTEIANPCPDLNNRLNELYSHGYYSSRWYMYLLYNEMINFFSYIDNINHTYNPMFNVILESPKSKKEISDIIDILDKRLSSFSNTEPKTTDAIKNKYYDTLKSLSEPFEAKFSYSRMKGECEYNFYLYKTIKIYRNWSSHNLFNDKEKINEYYFYFISFIEVLLYFNQSAKNNHYINDINSYIAAIWSKLSVFFPQIDTKEEHNPLFLKDIQKDNWELCKELTNVPVNMIDIYENYGKKNNVEHSHFFGVFLNAFIDRNINYGNDYCKSDYKLSNNCVGVYHDLFFIAYDLYKNAKRQSTNT